MSILSDETVYFLQIKWIYLSTWEHVLTQKHCHAICLKFRDIFFTSLTKLVLHTKASIYSTTIENLLLYCHKFSAFVITSSVLIKNAVCDRNH